MKVLEIKECYKCYYKEYNTESGYYCIHPTFKSCGEYREIFSTGEIPEWCPLPDAESEEK